MDDEGNITREHGMENYVSMEEEILSEYLVTAKKKKIWNIEIQILLKFMEVCDQNHLKYFVAHGTLLGAVRHKGFIPWDDDIDVNMPRADYERLKQIAPNAFLPPYFFQVFESDPDNFVGHGKLRIDTATGIDLQNIGQKNCNNGLFIDIFPMDGIIEDETLRKEQSVKVEQYRGLLLAKLYGEKYRYFVKYDQETWKKYCTLSKFYSAKYLNDKFEEWCSKYSCTEGIEREGIISFKTDYECCYWYKEDYENIVYLDFEKIKVPAPQNYRHCLEIKWKNYMDFPPKQSRGYKHNDVIMEPDIPYEKYDAGRFEIDFESLKKKKIILFGAGNVARDYLGYAGTEYPAERILDNNPKRWGDSLLGVKICGPEILNSADLKDAVVIVTSTFFKEIETQLQEMGWGCYYIYLEGRIYNI